MTTQTISAGWLFLGLSLLVLGALAVSCVASERGSAAADNKRLKADNVALAADLDAALARLAEALGSPVTQVEWEQHVASALEKTERAVAPVAPVIPLQRTAVES